MPIYDKDKHHDVLASEAKQRGFYSDILSDAAAAEISKTSLLRGPRPETAGNPLPKARALADLDHLEEQHRLHQNALPSLAVGATTISDNLKDVPPRALEPKVIVPFKPGAGKTPRRIEIERKKRLYAAQDIEALLKNVGVDSDLLLGDAQTVLSSSSEGDKSSNGSGKLLPFLSLQYFDDTEFEVRTSEEWISLGVDSEGIMRAVPGKALYCSATAVKASGKKAVWADCRIVAYNPTKNLFKVFWQSDDGRTYANEAKRPHAWMPRIYIMFLAENPIVFANRVAAAVKSRATTEALLRYELFVDCMPTDDIVPIEKSVLDRIAGKALNTSVLRGLSHSKVLKMLVGEVATDYAHEMNRIVFDTTVSDPGTKRQYDFVTVPVRSQSKVREIGTVPIEPYSHTEQEANFRFNSFLTKPEVINAITKVRAECTKVSRMSLFNTVATKSVRLDEFEQIQTQLYVQVQTYLKETWLSNLRNMIRNSLKEVGKGWFNMAEKNKEVYEISKLKNFMTVTKFVMQDTLRFLVLDSVDALVNMIEECASSVLKGSICQQWPDDNLSVSPYRPKRNPLFLLDLVVDSERGFRYSTKLGLFETILISVFDKAIISTKSVSQLEQLVMEDLFWATVPVLESVHEEESYIVSHRHRIREVLRAAIVPLVVYSKAYSRFLPLVELNIDTYISSYDQANHTVLEFKREIEKHLEMRENVELCVPQNISIGLFWINCEGARTLLSKRCRDLAKAVMDLLARRMRRIADDICNEFRGISKKIFERPGSIEELAEQRTFMKSVPDRINEIQVQISRMLLEYETLDEYYYALSIEDFQIRWTAFGWPKKILSQISMADENLDKDNERFQKDLVGDQVAFEERLDTLAQSTSGFSSHKSIENAPQIAKEIHVITSQLKDCQKQASLFNQRENLFGMPLTSYAKLAKLTKDFEPYKNLWQTTADWLKWHNSWLNDPFLQLDPESVDSQIQNAWKLIHKSVKIFKDQPDCLKVAQEVQLQMDAFRPNVPLIQAMRNPGMRDRHWIQLSSDLGFDVKPDENFTFAKCLELKLQDHITGITKVSEIAGKEYSIEAALDKMEAEWETVILEVLPYRDTGTYIMKGSDDSSQLLDDHIVMTQSMAFSPYKKPFEYRITKWESTLKLVQDVMEEWLMAQKSWLYLEPIFSSDDINRQLPMEAKRFQTMDRIWRKIMTQAKSTPKVIVICPDARMLDSFRECNKLLDQVQKGLTEYLETKRMAFPRFYFLSDDELLEILSQTKDPKAVQPHLRKCFENVSKLEFEDDLRISAMYSGEGERVPFHEDLYPKGNVEDWLREVERVMMASLRVIIESSLEAYAKTLRTEWVLQWAGQVVIGGSQTYWTAQVAAAIEDGSDGLDLLYKDLCTQMDGLVDLVRSDLSQISRIILSALIVIDVHGRDVVTKLIENEVGNSNDFEWISQLRFYWDDDLLIKAMNAVFKYGYEYLGNTGRLVITPLTDRCYLTLTGALHLKMGGAPAGPAGTGKTETVKDLAKAVAIQCVVFNCSDQLDYMAMGKFLKGLASAGAWSCFDEFNRIDIEVLSVIAQQLTTIQQAQVGNVARFMFEGVDISLRNTCAAFITMNPGYAGRTELPDNLKALFRPVAMMVPDYGMIAEIMLYSFGFSNAKSLAEKIVSTFRLSSEQLSSQDHYDFGMRAVKTVISAAGNLKRDDPNMKEELIMLRALKDVNVPKFLAEDLILFNGIISDLFPGIEEAVVDYGELVSMIREASLELNLQCVPGFLRKCTQLYDTTVVRHGLMLVGPTGSGKTMCYRVLAAALNLMYGKTNTSGGTYERVTTKVVAPKAITMGQLYGEFDAMTHEWTDGILSTLVRQGSADTSPHKKWFIFDGPVDAIWIENMNTVLDDNKKLCLSSGEIIKLSDTQTMMFEVEDLAVASPATVSRCGMVYLEPSILGLNPFIESWLNTLPEVVMPFRLELQNLFHKFLEPCIEFLRKNVKEVVPTVNSNLCTSLMRFLDCHLSKFVKHNEEEELDEELQKKLPHLIEPWFCFSLIWSVGATSDTNGRIKMDSYLRKLMSTENVTYHIPDENLVYDYVFDTTDCCWRTWLDGNPPSSINLKKNYSDIIVSTGDTVRYSYLLDLLLNAKKQVLIVGPTGTGKTMIVADKLLNHMPANYLTHFLVYSARTSANQSQDIIDTKLDKRRKGVFGPPLGKHFILFIDDLNMPALEEYGAQPPVELLRQWMDHRGWYDRKAVGSFRELVDISFICAMGPPGGGRNMVTNRFTRHFNFLSFTEMHDVTKATIFVSIMKSYLTSFPSNVEISTAIVNATISLYNLILENLLPTPAKSHYTFNLRDMSRVFQGILMADPVTFEEQKSSLVRLWCHECTRVFRDRLINDEDRMWFDNNIKQAIPVHFEISWSDVVKSQPLLYGDFIIPNAEKREYVEIDDLKKMVRVVEEYLDDYNATTTAQMKLVLFLDALCHVTRISRVLRQNQGNALLLGVGGSGRQSLTRLSAFMADIELFQIELSKNYGMVEWRDDVKRVLTKSGVDDRPIVFLFTDTQIKSESFLEDINNILSSGDVPGIFGADEIEQINATMRPLLQLAGIPITKANMFQMYTKRVRNNVHIVLCMSPLGEPFRERLRMFPSLVNACTIDWFSEWPDEALRSVAASSFAEMSHLDSDKVVEGLVQMCVFIHQSVARASINFINQLNRHNYVTPTSYLELLGIFSDLIGKKKEELFGNRKRTATGLEKLLTTAKEVELLQQELEAMQPLLMQATRETEETMARIAKDKVVAEETRTVVIKEEKQASAKAEETKAIADDAQRDLDEALPALDAALASLKSLNKNDVVEVRSMQRPPPGVKLVIEAVCIMKQVKPKRVDGAKMGTKVDDYWEPGKALLANPQGFLESLFKYDKDNIADSVIQKIQPYIDSEEFTVANISKVSKACTSICQWARAMHKYHYVSKGVAPKRARLKEAQESLEKTLSVLNDAKKRLRDVELNLKELEKKYAESVAKKEELGRKCDECSLKLTRAQKLIGGLRDEKTRWQESVERLDKLLIDIVGDGMISAGTIAYLGPFTGEFRARLVEEWDHKLSVFEVPHTANATLVSTLGDPVVIRKWEIDGLPRDGLSKENGTIVHYSRRWPLFIDPQGQANKWVKSMEKDNSIDVIKLTDRDFLRSLENAIRFGKPCLLENVGEELDPALEPILLRQTFKQAGNVVIKVGDAVIPYHDDFKFYITTKLPNPHYTPEVSVKVTLVNFTLAPSGLEDQLLGIIVAEERPDLEEAKNQLIVGNAKMQQELEEIEDQILHLLSSVQGSPVDDERLIETLDVSKKTSEDILVKLQSAQETERDIDITRSKYIPVAVRTQLLFFCITDLSSVDPMYQYSLSWFINLFLAGIKNAESSDDVESRIGNINDYFTFSLYVNVCRSVFERHKLLFSFLLCIRILIYNELINLDEWKFLLTGGTTLVEPIVNPANWLPERSWLEMNRLAALTNYSSFCSNFDVEAFKVVFDSVTPHRELLPDHWQENLDSFQKLLVLRCLRPDKFTNGMQDFVSEHLGQRYIEPQTAALVEAYRDSSATTPVIFVLSQGTDPASDLYKFAEEMRFSKKLTAISLGQGQGPRAEALMKEGMDRGLWVFFQNCHLAPSWMPAMERTIECISPDKVHRDFRLWLTSMPSNKFPVSVLQNGVKLSVEPPRGIKANLLRSYQAFDDDFLSNCNKVEEWKQLLCSLCFFHGVLLERRKFGPLGFNIPYAFTDGDLRICVSQLKIFLDEYEETPYKVLKYTVGDINYGGRVTDDWDRRCVMNILADYYSPLVLEDEHPYSPSGIYISPSPTNHKGYSAYFRSLPINDSPEIFGLHDNADITYAQAETITLLNIILALQPRSASAGAKSREEVVSEAAEQFQSRLPLPFDEDAVSKAHPIRYEESMSTVLNQEVLRFNKLLRVLHETLHQLLKALKGLVVMSSPLERMTASIFTNKVPDMWEAKAYPSLKPLASWFSDLLLRLKFLHNWIENGIPSVFWISGFFFPQAFLTGTLQNYARRMGCSIDTVTFDFEVMDRTELSCPDKGCYINGLFLEGARWDAATGVLGESKPKELFTTVPPIWLIPKTNHVSPNSGFYKSPVYKTLTRAGTLSTTGHSTNYVLSIELPSDKDQQHWIKRATALLCALNY